jgi:hypothetical protein
VTGKRGPAATSRRSMALGKGDLVTSLVLIFPLFLLYGVGVMFADTVNGVDFVTRWLYALVGYDRTRYFIVHIALAVVFLGLLAYLRHRRRFEIGGIAPMLLESAIYALTLGTLIVFVMQNLLGFSIGSAHLALGRIGEVIVTSMGAGVHEELVFRLGMMAGGALLLGWLGCPRMFAVGLSLIASSLVFSAAHHVGPLGDDWDLGVFTYRALAGAAFGCIFYFRSLAHAVYAHFLYDVYVMLLRGAQ